MVQVLYLAHRLDPSGSIGLLQLGVFWCRWASAMLCCNLLGWLLEFDWVQFSLQNEISESNRWSSLPTWLRQHFDPSRVDNIDGYFLSSCKAIIIWCLVCALDSMCFGKVSWLEKSWMTKTWQVGFDIMCVLKKNPINTKHLSFNLQLKLCQNW